MNAFAERAFCKDEPCFSSYAFRIDAARILGNILAIGHMSASESGKQVESVDSSLTSWLLNLPASKRDVLDREGNADEMIFQAHMIINASVDRM